MLKLNRDLSFYSAYFDGLQDIRNCRSCKEVAKGLFKLSSLGTLVVPIFVMLKMHKIKSELDALEGLKRKVTQVINNNKNEKLNQMELVKFLVTCVQDKSAKSENELFGSAFKMLEVDSQKAFFAQVSKENQLKEALNYIPKDVTKLAFSQDTCSNWYNRCKNIKKIDESVLSFAKALVNFPKLEEVEYDLSKITYYTDDIKSHFDFAKKLSNAFLKFNIDSHGGTENVAIKRPGYDTYLRHHHANVAKKAIETSLLYRRDTNKDVKFSFKFKDSKDAEVTYHLPQE